MAGDKIEVNYDELQRSAKIFESEAENIKNLHNRLRSQVENLHGGGWIGTASDTFHREMEEEVLIRISRLYHAMEMSSDILRRITDMFQQAEDEASGLFKQG
ncbi:MAG: WXG100 family type VII secretion target [Anaerolineaceae bacterium]|nr:WXG100 family type VII secretion target [Anaerolineaceae bacterium]